MIVLGIDPGQYQSSFVLWDGYNEKVIEAGTLENHEMRLKVSVLAGFPGRPEVAIERIVPHGNATPMAAIETVEWIGRFQERCYHPDNVHLIPRIQVRKHLCLNGVAKDTNISTALKDRFGPPRQWVLARGEGGNVIAKKSGPNKGLPKMVLAYNSTYGYLVADQWQAFAVAVTCYDQAMEGVA